MNNSILKVYLANKPNTHESSILFLQNSAKAAEIKSTTDDNYCSSHLCV